MGVYESVYFDCPNCGAKFELQPRPPDSTCQRFLFPYAPKEVHDALEYTSPLDCDGCGTCWAYSKRKGGLFDYNEWLETQRLSLKGL